MIRGRVSAFSRHANKSVSCGLSYRNKDCVGRGAKHTLVWELTVDMTKKCAGAHGKYAESASTNVCPWSYCRSTAAGAPRYATVARA